MFRLSAGIVLAVALSTGVYTTYLMQSARVEANQKLQERVERYAAVLSQALARPLFDINSAAVSSVVDALGATPEVVGLRVLSPTGSVLASLGGVDRDPATAVLVHRSIGYTDGNRTYPVGSIELAYSRQQIDRDLRRQILETAAANLLLTVVILVCIFFVARRIAGPFGDIQRSLERLAQGETDIELSGIGRRDQIGRLSVAVKSFRDTLTRLREAEQVGNALLDEKSRMVDRLNAIFEGSQDALMLLTEEGYFDCNRHTLTMFGMPGKEAFIKCHPSTLSPPLQADGQDSHTAANERIRQALERGQARFEWVHRRADGSDFPAEVLLSAFDYGGRQVLQATVRDITARKAIEQQLRELNEDLEQKIEARTEELTRSIRIARHTQSKLQAIVDTALDAVVRMDRHGRIVGWNRQAEKIFNWSREEAIGQPLDQTIIPQRYREAHRHGMHRFLESGSGAVLDTRIEIYALRRDGSEFPIELSITQVRMDDTGDYEFCSFIRDISERREREQSLMAANVRAEAANVAKSEFLANMSHEIRTPMSAIIGMAYLALRTELNPKQHDYVGKIHRAALSLLGIINDILDFSKIEAGKLDVEEIPFFLDDVLSNVASVTSQKAADKQLEYLFHVPHTIPRHLVGDPLRLGQVLINLVNNAVKFTNDGELELSCTRIPCETSGKVRLRFAVRDTGIGMSAEQKAKLFRAFSQANGSTTREYGGTGLGLSISQQLVHLMGGSIEVQTAPNKGSTFAFELEFALSGLPERVTVMPAALNGARILLVDDSPIALDILVEALQALPLRVDTAPSGHDAEQLVRAADAAGDPYKVVLTDWQMMGMDGIELAQRITRPGVAGTPPKVILATAFGREEVQAEAERAGVDGFLFKPIGQSMLVDTLVSMFSPALPAPSEDGPQAPRDYAVRVLLVEDNQVNQQIAVELMAVQGISVDIASTGHQALEKLMLAGPDGYGLVLMDLEMPQLDGHEATIELRKDARFDKVPVIAMTAHALSEIRERCLREGMQDYITKPVDPEKLYSTLARWLGHAMPQRVAPVREPAAIPGLTGIDSALGLRHVAGNTELYLQLLDRFRASQRNTAVELKADFEAGRYDDVSKRAHTLRGVAGNIGARDLQVVAQSVEESMQLPNPEVARLAHRIATLEGALDAVLAALDRYFAASAADAIAAIVPLEPGESPQAALEHLQQLLAEFSGETTDYFDSVRKRLATLVDATTLERVAGHLAKYEFEEARGLLAAAIPTETMEI
ncbi:response regulator [Massilia arenosa]|uniref:Sensory/regulatory protein RpfC n=1 Tax=Zemynaea arenosa TaxID=2561931 RepID=A0A4Y9SMN1_9BURK|nr:response regulator [Massilia arenosa]TFW27808.1 response regulator [Massilia arenosa]